MRRADRLFEIIQILRTRRVTTARRLAERLEVSERTVYRDIADLLASGVPIEGEAGVGYALRKGFDLPPLMFTEEEIKALALGARIVTSFADPRLAQAAEQVLDKVGLVLPERLRRVLDATYLYAPVPHLTADEARVMGELRAAIDRRRKVRFRYAREDGARSHRTVWPLGLFFWGHTWTLGAWCELRMALRNFRLDRIAAIEPLDTFTLQPGRTVEDLFREGQSDHGCSTNQSRGQRSP